MGELKLPEFPFGKVWTKTAGRNEEFARSLLEKRLGECQVTDLVDLMTALGLDVVVKDPGPLELAKREAAAKRRQAREGKAA